MTQAHHETEDNLTAQVEQVKQSTKILSYKWHPIIIYVVDELDGAGYSEIEAVLDGISSKMLSDGLSDLCEMGVLKTTEKVEGSGITIYELTEKGRGLLPALHMLNGWHERHEQTQVSIMIVEDERMVADILSEYLSDSYAVEFVRTGEEAIAKYDQTIDVVIVDRHLTGISGDEVASEIKKLDEDALILAVSSLEPDNDICELEVDDYAQKPVSESEIKSRLELLLNRSELSSESREFLSIRSKQAALVNAYSEVAKEMEGYQCCLDGLKRLGLSKSEQQSLDPLVPKA